MIIAEVCPDCGAERPSWMGDSHYKSCFKHIDSSRQKPMHPKCCDGKSAEEFFQGWTPPYGRRRPLEVVGAS